MWERRLSLVTEAVLPPPKKSPMFRLRPLPPALSSARPHPDCQAAWIASGPHSMDHPVLMPEKPGWLPFPWRHSFSQNHRRGLLICVVSPSSLVSQSLGPVWGTDATKLTLFLLLLRSAGLWVRSHYLSALSFPHFPRHNSMDFMLAQLGAPTAHSEFLLFSLPNQISGAYWENTEARNR